MSDSEGQFEEVDLEERGSPRRFREDREEQRGVQVSPVPSPVRRVVEEAVLLPELTVVAKKKMGTFKLGGPKYEVTKFDGRSDYLLWEKQVKGVLYASGMGKLLKPRSDDIDQSDWEAMQEQGVWCVTLYLQPPIIKQLGEHKDCLSLFEALQKKYHRMELSNRLFTSFKLMSFRMKESGTKLQDHVDAFNDLVVDLENLGEELSDEKKALHLLSSLPPSYQSLSRVLLHRDRETISYNEVVSSLLTDDLQQKMQLSSQPSTSTGAALNVNRGRPTQRPTGERRTQFRSKSRSKSRGKSPDRKQVTCWKCGKAGHIKRDCKGKVAESSSANVARSEGEADLLNDEYVL